MKKLLTILIALIIFAPAWSQDGPKRGPKHDCKIEEFVDNLTPRQKHQIDELYKKSKEKTDKWEIQLRQVRDSIGMYLSMYGDHSNKVFPLFSRESELKKEINKERYRLKVKIDKILTKEQYRQMQTRMREQRHKGGNHPKGNGVKKNAPSPNATPQRPQQVPHKSR